MKDRRVIDLSEAYFEVQPPAEGFIQYPFHCHLQENCGGTTAFNAHWHYYIEILYALSGRARVFLRGEYYDLNPGDMLLINAREVHSGVYEGASTKYICIKFDPEVLYTTTRTVFESKYVLPFTLAKSSPQKIFMKGEIEKTPIPSLIQEIFTECTNKKYGFELAVRTHICYIFLWILRNWESKGLIFDAGRSLKESELQMLQKLFDYLDHNYSYDITVESAARMFNMSYSYFSRHFKALMGKTFTEYLNYIRITEAEKLLSTTDLNITQVALQTGFSDSNYFIKQFKHYKNITPKQFKVRILRGT